MKYIISVLLCAGLFISFAVTGQSQDQVDRQPTLQPTIMVIPFTRQGQSLRARMESDDLVRVAMTKVKEGFDGRGVSTIDLRARLKQLGNNEVLQEEQQQDMKDEVIKLSGADVFVEVEARPNRSSSGNSATLIMTAYDVFSGESYANKTVTSQKFHTDNFAALISKSVDREIDNFLNTINEKFTDISVNGRTVVMNVGVLDGATFDLDTEIGGEGDFLSDVIEDWVYSNSFNNYYHVQGTTSNKILFDIVKIPIKDDKGRNFRVSKFASLFVKYLNSIGYSSSRVINGNNITITLEENDSDEH